MLKVIEDACYSNAEKKDARRLIRIHGAGSRKDGECIKSLRAG